MSQDFNASPLVHRLRTGQGGRLLTMKTLKARHTGVLAFALALAGLFSVSPTARAEHDSRRGVLTGAAYQRMQQLAHQLEEISRHASEQSQSQQGGYRGFRRDTKFLKSIDHFADRAQRFHERMESYRTQSWNVDEEIEHLLRDARNVQKRLQRARFVDQHTIQDWNQAVSLLNRMSAEYRTGTTYASTSPYGTRYPGETYPGGHDHRSPGSVPDPHGSGSSYDPYRSGRSTDMRQLAYELEQRAARASDLAGRYNSGYASNIRHFSEQARHFRSQIDDNRLSASALRSQVNHLLEDAQGAHEELRRMNVSRDLAAEWDAVVQILTRMRDLPVV